MEGSSVVMMRMGLRLLQSHDITVILLTLCGRAQGSVGVRDSNEALRGLGVVGVAVGVVGFGKSVE